MERKLIEAAKKGDVGKLHCLIKDEPFLLRAVALAYEENPLHIACMGSHVDFVKEVLNLGPEFAKELNQGGLSPLHIASGRGDMEIVKELLKVDSNLCLVRGKEKRIPLHYAVSKGRTQVIGALLSPCLDSIAEVTARGETSLHLAVKGNQFEAFKVLCEHVFLYDKEDILNHKDEQGNTILHLAASRKQYEVFDLLLDKNLGYKDKLELNSLNKKGLTPLDVLISEDGDCEIEEMLTLAGATCGALTPQNSLLVSQIPTENQPGQEQRRDRPKSAYQKLLDYFKYDKIKEPPGQARNTLLVIAVLILTATYQAVLSPPGGVWQDDSWLNSTKNNTGNDFSAKQPPRHTAGRAVMGTHNPVAYGLFLLFNSIGFFTSLHMMHILTLGVPLQFELNLALFSLVITYDTCMLAIAPSNTMNKFFYGVSILVPLMMPILTKAIRDCKKGRRRELQSTTVSA